MQKETKEIIKLTTKEVLRFLENKFESALGPIDPFSTHPMRELFNQRDWATNEVDWNDFRRKVRDLKRRGLIRRSIEGKKYYLETTKEGKEYLSNLDFMKMVVPRPAKWDKKWRVVIYDIPEDDKDTRDAIRRKLYQIGFEQVQKSVFIYPFECSEEINLICRRYGERNCIKYMIADIIEGEESTTEIFLDKGILTPNDLI